MNNIDTPIIVIDTDLPDPDMSLRAYRRDIEREKVRAKRARKAARRSRMLRKSR